MFISFSLVCAFGCVTFRKCNNSSSSNGTQNIQFKCRRPPHASLSEPVWSVSVHRSVGSSFVYTVGWRSVVTSAAVENWNEILYKDVRIHTHAYGRGAMHTRCQQQEQTLRRTTKYAACRFHKAAPLKLQVCFGCFAVISFFYFFFVKFFGNIF